MGGGGGNIRSLAAVVELGGARFSLSFSDRAASSSFASFFKFFADLGRDKRPARLVADLLFFGLVGEEGGASPLVLVLVRPRLNPELLVGDSSLVGDRAAVLFAFSRSRFSH